MPNGDRPKSEEELRPMGIEEKGKEEIRRIVAEMREIKEGKVEISVELPNIGRVSFELDGLKDFFGRRIDLEEATIIEKIRAELSEKREARFGATWRSAREAFDKKTFELIKEGKRGSTSEEGAFYQENIFADPKTGVKLTEGRRFREGENEGDWYKCQKIDFSGLDVFIKVPELEGKWQLILQEMGEDVQIGKHPKEGRREGRTWTLGGIKRV